MFCLRSWLPLLFIPTNASPLFVVTFFFLTYFLNRPCVYCSILLVILFVTSCYWSDQCFFDLNSNWFEPRHIPSAFPNPLPQAHSSSTALESSFLLNTVNSTAAALGNATVEELKRRMASASETEWSGIGVEWLRSWLGGKEWRVPCLDVYVRL